MFTHTVDDAINRINYKGMEIAVTYDDCASNPLDDMEIQGFAIRSHERNTIDYDPDRTLLDYQGLVNDKEEALDYIGWMMKYRRQEHGDNWWEVVDENTPHYARFAQSIIEAIEAIDDYDSQLESYEVYEYVAVDEYGHPRYTVVVDMPWFKKTWGPSCSEYKDIALSIAKEYAAWANGSVYIVGVEREDEEADYMGGFVGLDVFDNEALIEIAENYF